MVDKKTKLKYEVVLFGKSLRKMLRSRKHKRGILTSPLGQMRPRRERRIVAKQLKMPFVPRYNGEVFKLKHESYVNEKGYIKYKSILEEVK